MSIERRDFTEVYDAIQVPSPLKTASAKDPELLAVEKQFFQEVQDSLSLKIRSLLYYFRYTTYTLAPRSTDHESISLDDSIRIFRLRGGQALASALYHRNEVSGDKSQTTHFTKYALHPETVEAIDDIRKLGRILYGDD